MTITPTFTIVNSANVDQVAIDQFQALAATAFNQLGSVLAGDAQVTVRIEFTTETLDQRAEVRWGNGLVIGQDASFGYVVGGAAAELQGVTGRGQGDFDIWIRAHPDYLANELFIDPTPLSRDDIPTDRSDGLSIILQLLGNALGFSGYYNQAQNTYDYALKTAFDARLTLVDGQVYFDGPNVRAVLGGPAPMSHDNYRKYGNVDADPAASHDPLVGLMNGAAFHRGFGYTIGDLDLAFMADMGIGTTRDDILDVSWVPAMHGGSGNDSITGGAGDNLLTGDDGNDMLRGGAGRDMLQGGAGNDRLDGGSGADTMFGGAGNDTYIVDAAADRIFETATASPGDADPGGNDTVKSTVSFSLSARGGTRFIENLMLLGPGNIRGAGNDLANRLTGNDHANSLSGEGGNDVLSGLGGNDFIVGGAGHDTLTGGAGADAFMFDNLSFKAADRDSITDFNKTEGDRIRLKGSVFGGLEHLGSLKADEFYAAPGARHAHDLSDRVVYDTTSGILYYDADGLGGQGALQIAVLGTTNHPGLGHGDILIVA